MKNRIRLTESDLNRIVKESVRRMLKEGSTEHVSVNKPMRGKNKYEVKIQHEFSYLGATYVFTVYAYDEVEAIDLVLDLISKKYPELQANVPEDFTGDYGYDENGGYTTYGDDSDYVYNSQGTIAVKANCFDITEIE